MNGIPLVGQPHKEVINILKELPLHVYLVCSRMVTPSVPDSSDGDGEDVRLTLKELLAEFNEKVSVHTKGLFQGKRLPFEFPFLV